MREAMTQIGDQMWRTVEEFVGLDEREEQTQKTQWTFPLILQVDEGPQNS